MAVLKWSPLIPHSEFYHLGLKAKLHLGQRISVVLVRTTSEGEI
jgi:hypothetical protein